MVAVESVGGYARSTGCRDDRRPGLGSASGMRESVAKKERVCGYQIQAAKRAERLRPKANGTMRKAWKRRTGKRTRVYSWEKRRTRAEESETRLHVF